MIFLLSLPPRFGLAVWCDNVLKSFNSEVRTIPMQSMRPRGASEGCSRAQKHRSQSRMKLIIAVLLSAVALQLLAAVVQL